LDGIRERYALSAPPTKFPFMLMLVIVLMILV
jgi:hypothetical protein